MYMKNSDRSKSFRL